MNKLNILLLAILTSALAYAFIGDPPLPVEVVLKKQYPKAREIKWRSTEEYFIADFNTDSKAYSVVINLKGKVIETRHGITVTDLPDGLMRMLDEQPGLSSVMDVQLISRNDQLVYEVNTGMQQLFFDPEGNSLPKLQSPWEKAGK